MKQCVSVSHAVPTSFRVVPQRLSWLQQVVLDVAIASMFSSVLMTDLAWGPVPAGETLQLVAFEQNKKIWRKVIDAPGAAMFARADPQP